MRFDFKANTNASTSKTETNIRNWTLKPWRHYNQHQTHHTNILLKVQRNTPSFISQSRIAFSYAYHIMNVIYKLMPILQMFMGHVKCVSITFNSSTCNNNYPSIVFDPMPESKTTPTTSRLHNQCLLFTSQLINQIAFILVSNSS